jgi:tripartite-type tricarboxylate transporter receptor subunit TctC
VFVPSGTPPAVVEKLADALGKGLNEEAVQKRLADLGADGVEPGRRGPGALADLVKSEAARLLPILRPAAEK